jgi:hypothetical protein
MPASACFEDASTCLVGPVSCSVTRPDSSRSPGVPVGASRRRSGTTQTPSAIVQKMCKKQINGVQDRAEILCFEKGLNGSRLAEILPDGLSVPGVLMFRVFFRILTVLVFLVLASLSMGTAFADTTYTAATPGFAPGPGDIAFVPNPNLSDFTGTPVLDLMFATMLGLTNAGGTVPLFLGNPGSSETTCGDAGCTFGNVPVLRFLATGVVIGAPNSMDNVTWTLSGVTFVGGGTATGSFVFNADTDTLVSANIVTTTPKATTPEPSAFLLLGMGLVPLLGAAKRRIARI